ncbi:flagellar export chaperone FliS [Uliginosibacterium sp. 31-16]|uniref:flagellar export chaperone FliS n=1 Tax=Uliginosibacterium sp. 31-16 TaxID=3068315 RepID=UPI00273EA82F|nr:flagellar export chaperone FliS [Uliginosibacterium sp. 31-16]MDP5240683.1 flagellar export chaperone FliS [Uliginosibacterium sp. 31-16]
MFARNSAATYAKVGIETNVSSADPHQLILMLFDGALLSVNSAAAAIEGKDNPAKIRHITKAIEIITMGLKASLDSSGGELTDRLSALYDYMGVRLALANAQSNVAPLIEVSGLLRDLREAWAQISDATRDEKMTQEA